MWNPVAGATGYRIEIQSYGGSWFTSTNTTVAETSFTHAFGGDQPGRWRVTALDSSGIHTSSAPSGWRTFTYVYEEQLRTPTLVSPADGASWLNVFPRTTTYTWNPVAGATGYRIEIQMDTGSWTNWKTDTVTGTSYTNNFAGDQPGRWRVTALDSTPYHTDSNPSAWRGFTYVYVQKLTTPVLTSPANGAQFGNYPRTTTYTWNPVAGATSYRIEVEINMGSWSDWVTATTTGTSYSNDFGGMNQGRWRVTALATAPHTDSDPSAWRTFTYTV